MPTHAPPLDEHPTTSADPSATSPIRTEWVLTNAAGGFAMGTVLGTPTRRYHGLLIAATKPPVCRVMALSAVDECLILNPGTSQAIEHRLTPFHFAAAEDRCCANPNLTSFERDDRVTWTYRFETPTGTAELKKSVELADGRNAVIVRYDLPEQIDARIELRPLFALRDFHSLCTGHEPQISARPLDGMSGEPGVLVTRRDLGVHLSARGCDGFDPVETTWSGVEYLVERERGLDDHESLFCPGVFTANAPGSVELIATTDASGRTGWIDSRDARRRRRRGMIDTVLDSVQHAGDERTRSLIASLAAAADDFVVHRANSAPGKTSVIAGYPWFSDWGRDTMIAMPGLLLVTGRTEEAFDVLRTFAGAQRRGLIPNRFDDDAGPAHYNTVDASLWFLYACAEWTRVTGDTERFTESLLPACKRVIDAYQQGTDYNIRVDIADGLVAAGSPDTQLTWMDAKRDGVVFTPRHGKAVEINALWIHGLRVIADLLDQSGDKTTASEYRTLADRAAESFNRVFSNGPSGGLIDCLTPEPNARGTHWESSTELRPNQIFAARLEHSPLDQSRRKAVVNAVREHLLTPSGLRTLAPNDPCYCPAYSGPLFERDGAYHNGTVWPWLLGSYCEAAMRAEDWSDASRSHASELLLGLADRMNSPSLGQLFEIADADPGPNGDHRFDGCPAQAWSIAETLRVLTLALKA